MEYVALDLETTGLDPGRDRVIEVGAVAFTTDVVLATLDRLVDPGRSVPDAVLKLTGIQAAELRGARTPELALQELAEFVRGRQPIGHGATLDTGFLVSAGLWEEGQEIIDTLHVARILIPAAPSHSLPLLAADLGLEQPRPHRALDDADATRQLFLRLREEAAALDEGLKEAMLALVAPYRWAEARFFAEALSAASSPPPCGVKMARRRPRMTPPTCQPCWDRTGPWHARSPTTSFASPSSRCCLRSPRSFSAAACWLLKPARAPAKASPI